MLLEYAAQCKLRGQHGVVVTAHAIRHLPDTVRVTVKRVKVVYYTTVTRARRVVRAYHAQRELRRQQLAADEQTKLQHTKQLLQAAKSATTQQPGQSRKSMAKIDDSGLSIDDLLSCDVNDLDQFLTNPLSIDALLNGSLSVAVTPNKASSSAAQTPSREFSALSLIDQIKSQLPSMQQMQQAGSTLVHATREMLSPTASAQSTPMRQPQSMTLAEEVDEDDDYAADAHVPSAPPLAPSLNPPTHLQSPMSPPTSRVKRSAIKPSQFDHSSLHPSQTGSTAFPTVPNPPVSHSPMLQHCVQARTNSKQPSKPAAATSKLQISREASNGVVVAASAPPPPPPPTATDYTKPLQRPAPYNTGGSADIQALLAMDDPILDDSNKENAICRRSNNNANNWWSDDDSDAVGSLEDTASAITLSARRTTNNFKQRKSMLSPSALQQRAEQLKHRTPNRKSIGPSNSNSSDSQLRPNAGKQVAGTEGLSHLEMIQFAGKLKKLKPTAVQRSPGGTPLRRSNELDIDDSDPFKQALFSKFKNTGLRSTASGAAKGRLSTGVSDHSWDT